jgi:hypothetical protein
LVEVFSGIIDVVDQRLIDWDVLQQGLDIFLLFIKNEAAFFSKKKSELIKEKLREKELAIAIQQNEILKYQIDDLQNNLIKTGEERSKLIENIFDRSNLQQYS